MQVSEQIHDDSQRETPALNCPFFIIFKWQSS
jgi:hypothetical protein